MFQNLKVLELASVLAGPSVGQFFAELGAEVIKVENAKTGGDVTRSWKAAGENTDDRSAYYCSVNWGKKSLALDLTKAEDLSIVHQLAADTDVVIVSYKSGDAERLGVSYEQLKVLNKKIIYGRITGYGPSSDQVGYDAVIQAESGFMSLNGEKNGEALKMPVALVDVLAGHHLKEGLLLALLNKERSGEGSLVEVSLLDAAVASLVNQASNWLVGGKVPERQGSLHPNIAPYGESFDTRDGKKLLLAIGSDRQFIDLCEILDLSNYLLSKEDIGHELLAGRFSTNVKRVENRVELREILAEKIILRDSQSLMAAIHKKKIPAGLIMNVKEALESREVQQLLMNQDSIAGVRSFIATGNAWKGDRDLSSPPHLGEHNKEIFERLNTLATKSRRR